MPIRHAHGATGVSFAQEGEGQVGYSELTHAFALPTKMPGPPEKARLERFQEMTLSHFRFDNFGLQLANLAHHFLLFPRRHLELFQRIGQMIDHNIELFFGNP